MYRKAEIYDAAYVADLHREGIPTGFLSSLSPKLLASLYGVIIEEGLSFVAVEDDKVIGFVSGSADSKALYKKIVKKNFFRLIPLFFKKIFSYSFFKRSLESFLIPFKTGKDEKKEKEILPELLSIVISKNIQAKGIGSGLVKCLEEELMKRDIGSYKVLAGDNLISANKFYLKNDFTLYEKLELHKGQVSNVYVKVLNG
ncbi:MAG: GNAT family N-acetyltransferase [Candidatus Delongbacteria bacterium]|nr:GNAT family N-acetyltransferase [Candidatus Delongbacteria bacterium]